MDNTAKKNLAAVSYLPAPLLARVREDAVRCNRTLAGQIREVLTEAYQMRRETEHQP